MEIIVKRRRLPPRVRSMLTDIAPREEHLRDEQEVVDKDGILLPSKGVSGDTDSLTVSPATDSSNVLSVATPQVCGLCLTKPHCYTCPRCNVMYCSLACYRSPRHSACSEEFYKESVFEELKSTGLTDKESKEKMQEILLKMRKNEGGIEQVSDELGEELEPGGPEALGLLSRLAEIQASGEGNPEEIQRIIAQLQDIDQAGETLSEDGVGEDGDGEDLSAKLAGLDINSMSEEQLWSLLSPRDREQFEGLLKARAFAGLVPIWKPWWEYHDQSNQVLLEVLSEESSHDTDDIISEGDGESKVGEEGGGDSLMDQKAAFSVGREKVGKTREPGKEQGEHKSEKEGPQNKDVKRKKHRDNTENYECPAVNIKKIPPLQSLTKNPSPLLGHTLVNVLYGYTFSLCLFNGDISEEDMTQDFCQAVLSISEGLSTARAFGSIPESLEAGMTAVSTAGYYDSEDPRASARAVEAVAHILSGKSKRDSARYSLAALAELHRALGAVRKTLPKESDSAAETRKTYFQAMKKCEFLQSWTKENGPAVGALALGVWKEHLRKEREMNALDEDKKVVEKNMRTGGVKGSLIEEIN